jgi:hypothetical protein
MLSNLAIVLTLELQVLEEVLLQSRLNTFQLLHYATLVHISVSPLIFHLTVAVPFGGMFRRSSRPFLPPSAASKEHDNGTKEE